MAFWRDVVGCTVYERVVEYAPIFLFEYYLNSDPGTRGRYWTSYPPINFALYSELHDTTAQAVTGYEDFLSLGGFTAACSLCVRVQDGIIVASTYPATLPVFTHAIWLIPDGDLANAWIHGFAEADWSVTSPVDLQSIFSFVTGASTGVQFAKIPIGQPVDDTGLPPPSFGSGGTTYGIVNVADL